MSMNYTTKPGGRPFTACTVRLKLVQGSPSPRCLLQDLRRPTHLAYRRNLACMRHQDGASRHGNVQMKAKALPLGRQKCRLSGVGGPIMDGIASVVIGCRWLRHRTVLAPGVYRSHRPADARREVAACSVAASRLCPGQVMSSSINGLKTKSRMKLRQSTIRRSIRRGRAQPARKRSTQTIWAVA